MEDKVILGLGMAALISGVIFIAQEQYAIGIPGAIVGLGLALQSMKKIRAGSR